MAGKTKSNFRAVVDPPPGNNNNNDGAEIQILTSSQSDHYGHMDSGPEKYVSFVGPAAGGGGGWCSC